MYYDGIGGEVQELKGKNTIGRDRSNENICQRVITDAQNVWWRYVGLPLHFRATRVAGLVKGVMQQSIFVVWESTWLAPRRFEWWMKKRAEDVVGKAADSHDLTPKDMRYISLPLPPPPESSMGLNFFGCLRACHENCSPPLSFLIHSRRNL